MPRFALSAAALLAVSASTGCATYTPSTQEKADACAMLKENRAWYNDLRKSARNWGAPIGLQLAIIRQESDFDSKARPAPGPRKLFGLLPGDRPSSAYGYAQALDMTWDTYKRDTGNSAADRHKFSDATDFVGWYVSTTGKTAGVGQYDYKAHYLAYHEGQKGYLMGTWKSKAWLKQRAESVAANATLYESQIRSCDLDRNKFLGLF